MSTSTVLLSTDSPSTRPLRRASNKGLNLRLILIALVIVGFAGFFGVRAVVRSARVSALKPQLETYLTMPVKDSMAHRRLGGRKVVCVCTNEHDFDESHHYLDDAMRASKPGEVDAIVQVTRREEVVGNYEGGGDAYRLFADVKVIDKATGEIIGETSIGGGEPPARKKRSQSGKGSKPLQEIADWLKTQ